MKKRLGWLCLFLLSSCDMSLSSKFGAEKLGDALAIDENSNGSGSSNSSISAIGSSSSSNSSSAGATNLTGTVQISNINSLVGFTAGSAPTASTLNGAYAGYTPQTHYGSYAADTSYYRSISAMNDSTQTNTSLEAVKTCPVALDCNTDPSNASCQCPTLNKFSFYFLPCTADSANSCAAMHTAPATFVYPDMNFTTGANANKPYLAYPGISRCEQVGNYRKWVTYTSATPATGATTSGEQGVLTLNSFTNDLPPTSTKLSFRLVGGYFQEVGVTGSAPRSFKADITANNIEIISVPECTN